MTPSEKVGTDRTNGFGKQVALEADLRDRGRVK